MGRVRIGGGVALAVLAAAAAGLGAGGCRGKAAAKTDPDAAASEAGALASAVVEGGALPEGGKAAARASLSQEQALEQATQKLADATNLAKDKKPDCDKIVDTLDVTFAMVNPAMGADDKATFATFASCAKKAGRWRLLRDVANAMIDGDPAYKSSYYLPRALLGLAQYEKASVMSKELLRSWPKEGEAYTTGAQASARLEDWTTCDKQADQAIAVQRQKGASDDIVAQAYIWKAETDLHTGKLDDSSRELDVAKRLKNELAAKLRDRNDVVKSSGLLAEPDIEGEIFLGLSHLYAKGLSLVGSPVILRLTAFSDKPVAARVEVSADALLEPIGKAVNVARARRETVKLLPPLHADTKPESLTEPKDVKLTYKVTSADGASLYEETRTVTVEPLDRMPTSIRVHETEYRMVHELDAAWVTPADKAITGILDAAKKRTSGDFAGTQGETLPQVQALWDELRSRGFVFTRDPSIDTEATRAIVVRLPRVVASAPSGSALEGTLVFASLMEAIGLEVLLVRLPGHALVGWLPTKADRGAGEAMKSTVPSPSGGAFFLDTTMIGGAPFDAAVLRGDAELVDSASKGVFSDGRATIYKLSALRKAGIVPKTD